MFELSWPVRKFSANLVVFALGSALLAGCGGNEDSVRVAVTPSSQVLTVVAVEAGLRYLYEPSALKAKPGEVALRFINQSSNQVPHRISIRTQDGIGFIAESGPVAPGSFSELKFTVVQDGSYEFVCLILGHAQRGQTGTLTVTR